MDMWLGAMIASLFAVFGAGFVLTWEERYATVARRRWRNVLLSCGFLLLVLRLLRIGAPFNNGPFCHLPPQAGGIACPPLWYSIITFAPVIVVSDVVLMYGFWLRRENTENAREAIIAPPR
jgi:hypothetical protein